VKQRWIRLFNIYGRDDLEEKLNKFLAQYPDSEIRVWNDKSQFWCASVIYSYPESFTNFKPEIAEES
jgi:hypothetical protein